MATTPKKKAPASSPAKRGAKPVATIGKSSPASPLKSSSTPSRRPRAVRSLRMGGSSVLSETIVPVTSPGKGITGGGSTTATSPRGTPRRGAADKAMKSIRAQADEMLIDRKDDDDDKDEAFDVKMEPDEEDNDNEALDAFDASPRKTSRGKAAVPRPR